MAERLTDRGVKALPLPATDKHVVYDDIVKGFGVRVTAAGSKSFVLNYRRKSDGVERRYTIGPFPEWTVARRPRGSQGAPTSDRWRRRSGWRASGRARGTDRQRSRRPIRGRAAPQAARLDPGRLPVDAPGPYPTGLGKRKVAALTFADIDALHRTITKRAGPYRANRVIALVSKLCSLAVQWQWRADNPCRGIERHDEAKRKRYLTAAELERFSEALASHDDRDAADIFRLLLLTGARRGEVLVRAMGRHRSRKRRLDEARRDHKNAHRSRRSFQAPARQLIAGRERTDSEYLFPGRHGGHRVELKANWRRICKAAGITGLRIHDLRHSYASQLASAGVGLARHRSTCSATHRRKRRSDTRTWPMPSASRHRARRGRHRRQAQRGSRAAAEAALKDSGLAGAKPLARSRDQQVRKYFLGNNASGSIKTRSFDFILLFAARAYACRWRCTRRIF